MSLLSSDREDSPGFGTRRWGSPATADCPIKVKVRAWSVRWRAGDDVDDLATAAAAELHGTGREREQGVIASATDVGAGVEVGAALTDDDLAGVDQLAAEPLHAQSL